MFYYTFENQNFIFLIEYIFKKAFLYFNQPTIIQHYTKTSIDMSENNKQH